MNILIISRYYLPIPAVMGGAVETLIESYLDENEKKFHDNIDVVSTPIPSNLNHDVKKYKYANFIYFKNKGKFNIYNLVCKICKKIGLYLGDYYINNIIKIIKMENKQYDIIISENDPFYTMLLKKNFNSKIVLHLHNDLLNRDSRYYSKIIKSCNYVLSVSDYIKKRVDCPQKCVTCYNGIDINLFNKKLKKDEKNLIRKKYNIAEDDFVFIFVGRIVTYKGISELLDAFLMLNQKYKNVKLFVVGGPNQWEKSENNFYNKVIKKKNENVIFTGYVNNSEIYKFYNISDVQITPSIFEEPFGLTVIEALAMNKRVIVSDAGALPEIVPKEYGTIAHRDHLSQNLVNAMEKEYLDRKKNNNCETYLKQFSKEEYSERIHENLLFINNVKE